MSKFKTFLIVFLSVIFLSISAVGCDMLQSGGASSSSGNSEIIDGEEDWEGNWERPDTPIEDEPVMDRCTQECYVCGDCLNNYEETCSKDICSHEEGRTKYVFNATDDNVKREGGVVIEGDHIGGINLNPNVVITFKINAAEDTVACLGATISRMVEDNFVASETPIYVNGEQYYSRGCSKAGSTVWTDFHTVWLGCIELKAGENELKFTNVSSDGAQYNFKDFTLLSSVELSWVIQERHQCESKNADGYCTDYECNEYACLNKNETGWKQLKIEGGDGRVLKYYINGKGEKQSLWNENEQVIGNIANSLVTGITDQTVIWAFEATEETYVRVSLNMSVSSGGTAFMEMFDITLNDESIETGGLTGKSNSGNVWTTFVDGTVAYVKVSAGRNVLKFVHKYTNAGDNIKYMTLSYEKGTLTTAPADENMVVVPVTGVTLTAAGDKTSLAVNSSLQLTATVEPENATNKFVSYKSSDDSIAMVNQTGLVTGLKEGDVTITVTTSDGAKTATVDLTVTAMQKPITEGAAYYFEGEEATFTAGIFGGININSNDANARNNTSLGNINCNNNAALTYKVNAVEATKAGLYLNLAFGIQTVENIFMLTVNGETVTLPTSFTAQGTANWVTYEEYWLANVDLVKGENVIVLTVTGGCGNYDYMKLMSEMEITLAGEETPEEPEQPEEPEEPITAGTAYYFEGEEATFTAGIFGGININSNDANARNNTSLGNVNNNNNAALTYKVNAAEATKAGLYLNLAFGIQTVENIFMLTVNGETVTLPTSFTAQGTANWVTYEEYWLANVDLVKGENVIVLTVTGGCGNYDYMKLVSTAEVTVVNA